MKTNVVVQQNGVNLLSLWSLDECLPRLGSSRLLLSVFFVGGSASVLVLDSNPSESDTRLIMYAKTYLLGFLFVV